MMEELRGMLSRVPCECECECVCVCVCVCVWLFDAVLGIHTNSLKGKHSIAAYSWLQVEHGELFTHMLVYLLSTHHKNALILPYSPKLNSYHSTGTHAIRYMIYTQS